MTALSAPNTKRHAHTTAALLLIPAAAVTIVALIYLGSELHALAAAGLTGTAPSGSSANAFKSLCDTAKANIIWVMVTALAVVMSACAGLMMLGSRTAPDWLGKAIGGILLVMVGIPGLLA